MSPCWAEGWAGLSYPFIDIIIPLAETLYSALELEWFKSVFLNTKSYFFSQSRWDSQSMSPGCLWTGFAWDNCCVVPLFCPYSHDRGVEKHGRARAVWSCPLWKLTLGRDPQECSHTLPLVTPSPCPTGGF